MDEQYPRNISVGFDGIPDGVDAAFALPASSYLSRERAYFFKGILVGMHDVFFFQTLWIVWGYSKHTFQYKFKQHFLDFI